MERMITDKSAEMCYSSRSKTHLVIDDDKMRNRGRSASEDLDWLRSKGLKSFGSVNNMMSSLTTNFYLGSTMTDRGESCLDTVERLFKRICF